MKSTGVLRRIDDLGRVVIPKEIRKNLRIRDGEPLEIFVNDDSIILAKHSFASHINDFAQLCADVANDIYNTNIIVTDRDHVIATSGPSKKKYLDQTISEDIANAISNRETYISNNDKAINLIMSEEEPDYFIGIPLIVDSDAIGLVAVISSDKALTDVEEKLVKFIAKLLMKQLEE